ncbi:rhodanese-like domain-containing protein [Isosphaeraceae bacterium EP7]
MSVEMITPTELDGLRKRGEDVELVDVRTPREYRGVHAVGARLVPLDSLDPKAFMGARAGHKKGPIYLICGSGGRSRIAAEKFKAAGYPGVVNVQGGMVAWEASALPVIRGEKSVSLERQVRIVAGLLVVAGTALGFFLNPAYLAIPAFVGAGLLFSGVSNTCGMGTVLAWMPWNRS